MTAKRLILKAGDMNLHLRYLDDIEMVGDPDGRMMRIGSAWCPKSQFLATFTARHDKFGCSASWMCGYSDTIHSWNYATVQDAMTDFQEWAIDMAKMGAEAGEVVGD